MIERSLAVTKVSSFPCKGNFSYAMRIRNASVNGKYSSCPTLLFHISSGRETMAGPGNCRITHLTARMTGPDGTVMKG